KQDYDLIVLDVNLPDGNGFDICREVKERRPDTAVIFLTANDMVTGFSGKQIAVPNTERHIHFQRVIAKIFSPEKFACRLLQLRL
ncbi:response regulator, partial [Faecalibacterium duncaniae]|uniref:response regulator n=1 Tax=Faecalibacterium duncaniae (strain DSM 17677 / JCM 31915 / A2-165) TaxID=411483 RepID=UPI0029408B3E